ncbi:MAG TPA: hypothetical protein PKD26_05975 [Pyrinomonadaceae bacterium]|nr:hypothetical protein [Pyrinomonadaceae bacterium]
MRSTHKSALLLIVILSGLTGGMGQRTGAPEAARSRPIIFAVLGDGERIEPIAYLEKNILTKAIDGASEQAAIFTFHKAYYRAGTKYRLIFGGADAGSVNVKSSDPEGECSKSSANISFTSQRARLRGNVMALATNVSSSTKGSGVRRLPTVAERSEIEALVRAHFIDQKIGTAVIRNLRYHNLTAIDVDGDGSIEMVGTFWVEPSRTSRAMLFFIADKGADGKYSFGYSDHRLIKQDEVMSRDVTDLDGGVYHERLLDLFDTDGNGTAEIFTYVQSFEGAGFNAYRREQGKWKMIFEGANYHCAY